jgi:hypothetical protein
MEHQSGFEEEFGVDHGESCSAQKRSGRGPPKRLLVASGHIALTVVKCMHFPGKYVPSILLSTEGGNPGAARIARNAVHQVVCPGTQGVASIMSVFPGEYGRDRRYVPRDPAPATWDPP